MCDLDVLETTESLQDVAECEADDIVDVTSIIEEADSDLVEGDEILEDISAEEELNENSADEIFEMDVYEIEELSKEENEVEVSAGIEEIPDVSYEMRSIADLNVTSPTLPVNGGHWSDPEAIGNSMWIPDDDTEVKWQKSGEWHSISGAELKSRFGIEGIEYHGNEPDFSGLEDAKLGHAELEEFSADRRGTDGTYDLSVRQTAERLGWSEDEVRQYMDEHGLTWHECGDRKTVRAIPTEINAAFKHTGGIGIEKSIEAVSDAIQDQYGTVSLDRNSLKGKVEIEDISEAIKSAQQIYRNYKKLGNCETR